jgi:hypothetical protein
MKRLFGDETAFLPFNACWNETAFLPFKRLLERDGVVAAQHLLETGRNMKPPPGRP